MTTPSAQPLPEYVSPQPRIENVPRGTLLALLTLPIGVAVWIVIWQLGFIASIIAFGISFLAVTLYRVGAGVMSRTGAVRATIITVVTLLIAIVGGMVSDALPVYVQNAGGGPVDALLSPRFWDFFTRVLTQTGYVGSIGLSLLAAVAFAVIGCLGTLRRAFSATAPAVQNPFDSQATGAAQAPSGTQYPAPATTQHPPQAAASDAPARPDDERPADQA